MNWFDENNHGTYCSIHMWHGMNKHVFHFNVLLPTPELSFACKRRKMAVHCVQPSHWQTDLVSHNQDRDLDLSVSSWLSDSRHHHFILVHSNNMNHGYSDRFNYDRREMLLVRRFRIQFAAEAATAVVWFQKIYSMFNDDKLHTNCLAEHKNILWMVIQLNKPSGERERERGRE